MRGDVRPAAVAGLFYPGEARALATTVDALLAEAAPDIPGHTAPPKALIVPHAGFVYSGPIAASAWRTVAPIAAQLERVVLVGPAHRVAIAGLAGPDAACFAGPLGETRVDTAALAAAGVPGNARAHAEEHALEVQLPFLARLGVKAAIVPIVTGGGGGARGWSAREQVAEVLDALWGGPETLIVVSSDLSHYLPHASASVVDAETAARIVALEDADLGGERACGHTAIAGLVDVARRRGLEATLLDRRTSADTAGDPRRVVGYGAFAFTPKLTPAAGARGRA